MPRLRACTAAMAALLLNGGCTGRAVATQAPAARFVGISDAVPSSYFDASTSAPDPLDPNRLVIGFDAGSDPTTLIARDFRASALPFSHRAAMDTISFTIEAPACCFVSRVTYTQRGTGGTGRTRDSAGGATWVVAGVPAKLGEFSDDPNLSGAVDLGSSRPTSVPISITVSLFASTGSVAVTGADVHVELLPLP